jgi:hypothetical protein
LLLFYAPLLLADSASVHIHASWLAPVNCSWQKILLFEARSICASEVVQHCDIFFCLFALAPTVRLRLVVCSRRTRRCGDFIHHRVSVYW